jgi:spoIIIJ-associated protein
MAEEIDSQVVEFTNKILELGGWDLEAEGESDSGALTVQIQGDDVSLLLARNAELLDAMEYICNRVFGRSTGMDSRIVLDSGNYRARREKELQLMAAKAAEKVKASRVPFSFDPMSPNERRIIHTALLDDNTVKTESRGDGIDRKVVIYPA